MQVEFLNPKSYTLNPRHSRTRIPNATLDIEQLQFVTAVSRTHIPNATLDTREFQAPCPSRSSTTTSNINPKLKTQLNPNLKTTLNPNLKNYLNPSLKTKLSPNRNPNLNPNLNKTGPSAYAADLRSVERRAPPDPRFQPHRPPPARNHGSSPKP